MRTITGDLITLADEGEFDIIIHGCNTEGIMGAGIAKQIADRWPEAVEADQATLDTPAFEKMGDYSKAHVVTKAGTPLIILNAYTQLNARGRGVLADHQAIEDVFKKVRAEYENAPVRIAFPAIGAGLARGNWDTIRCIIDTVMHYTATHYIDTTFVRYDG